MGWVSNLHKKITKETEPYEGQHHFTTQTREGLLGGRQSCVQQRLCIWTRLEIHERSNEHIPTSCMMAKKFTKDGNPITGIHHMHAVRRWGPIGCSMEGKATDSQ